MKLISKKPELTPKEHALSIAKYYDLPFHTLDPVRMQLLDAGPIDRKAITPPKHLTDLFQLEVTWKDRTTATA